jgi:hypothetical protein
MLVKRLWVVAIAAVLSAAHQPALAAGPRVAVLAAEVQRGAPANAQIMADALDRNLVKKGFDVLPAAKVAAAVRARGIDLRKPQPIKELAALRARLGVDYLVYSRVLSVGVGYASQEFQANVLVNVVGRAKGSFLHTRQVGQMFMPGDATVESAAIGPAEADQAAAKLLDGFYRRVGR